MTDINDCQGRIINSRKAIITKYALTSGPVVEVGVESGGAPGRNMFCVRPCGLMARYYHGNDYHFTKDDAVADIHKRHQRKKLSLLKQLAKLDKQRDAALETVKTLLF